MNYFSPRVPGLNWSWIEKLDAVFECIPMLCACVGDMLYVGEKDAIV